MRAVRCVVVLTHPVLLTVMLLDFGATLFGETRARYPIFAREIYATGVVGLGPFMPRRWPEQWQQRW